MPNWCENIIDIYGSKETLETVLEFLKGPIDENKSEITHFSLNKIVPMPSELLESNIFNDDEDIKNKLKEKFGFSSWYDWRIENWGVKWNADSEAPDFDKSSKHEQEDIYWLHYYFDTPWAPPMNAISKLSSIFPDIEIRLDYVEPGMGFQGIAAWKNGEMIEDEASDYIEENDDDNFEDGE